MLLNNYQTDRWLMRKQSIGKVKIKCVVCGRNIFTFPSRVGRKQFCSSVCRIKNSIKTLDRDRLKRIYKTGVDNENWKGGRNVCRSGYVEISSPNHINVGVRGYVQEHRLVMEKHLGRLLTANEVVHHINGIKGDNRIENLVLFANSKEHTSRHAKQWTIPRPKCLICNKQLRSRMAKYCVHHCKQKTIQRLSQ